MNPAFDLILLAQAIAALLFIGGLSPLVTVPRDRRWQAVFAGAMILSAAAVYDMDVINGPEIIGGLLAGGGIGWLLGREWPTNRLLPLLTLFTGLAATAMLFAAIAAWLNPYAFGLVEEASARIGAPYMLALALVAVAGVGASLCTLIALFRVERPVMLLLALAIAMAGWSGAAIAFLVDNIGLVFAGGLAGAAGTGVVLRLYGRARGKGLVDAGTHP